MNDEQRKALTEVIEAELDSYCPSPFNGAFAVSLMQIIDRLLTDRAPTAAEPDAEATVERVAKVLAAHESSQWHWDNDSKYRDQCRTKARAAIAAMTPSADDTVTRTFDEDESIARDLFSSGHDMGYEHAAEWLDDALDSVHPDAYIGNNFYRPDRQDYAVIVHWPLPDGVWSWRGFSEYRSDGTGPTRKAAILNACAKAKEASDATD